LRRCDAGVFRILGAKHADPGEIPPDSASGNFFSPGAGIYPASVRYRTVPFLFLNMKAQHMIKLLFAIPLVLITSAAVAQAPQDRDKGKDACARDVSRHCRAQMQEGDQLVLACLKTNRAKISKGCQQMLASHGQ
jgi:hypothetical protein